MKKFVVALFLIAFVFTALAGPNDSKSGIYFAPMLTSGHFGVLAHNTPEVYNTVSPRTLSLSTTELAPDRGLSFGGKLGIFFRPEVHERKNRLDVEVQFEYAPGRFWFQTIDATNTLYEQDYWLLDNKTITGRFRWSADVGDRWQPYVHLGYSIDMIGLGNANALSHGLNIGAGMRVRLCDHYAFYFEYETASLKSIDIAYADIDATANSALINSTSRTANLTLKPNYSMVSVSFEFPIEFCLRCKDAGGQNRGGTPGW